MKTIQAFTNEIDDLGKAVNELKSQIDESQFLENTCAVVFCGHEADTAELTAIMRREFSFPFIGCTGLGMLSSAGYSQSSITVLILTADDCLFEIGMTDEIYDNNDLKKVSETYLELNEKLGKKESLIFTYSPWWTDIVCDDIVKTLDRVSGGVPVFGGIASDGWTFNEDYVFCNDEISQKKVVMLLVSGNIRPIFTIEHSTTSLTNSHMVVTEAEGRTVYSLNNIPAADCLEEVGIINNKTDVILDYLATPFVSTIKTKDDDEIDILRCLTSIDHDKKTCSYIGSVENGSRLNMVLISKKDIEGSVKKAFDDIFEEIGNTKDYKYSAIFCSSCVARYCLIVSDKNTEGKAYKNRLPEGVNVQGFYSYGEYCPARGKKNGKLYNVLSNETLAILAI
ncbi:MAG: FIST signal transduction protein [Porcipelethomonas sp.]